MNIVAGRFWTGVLVAGVSICVVTAGWGVIQDSQLYAQNQDDPFVGEVEKDPLFGGGADPFGGDAGESDPFGGAGSEPGVYGTKSFAVSKTAKVARHNISQKVSNSSSLNDRMRAVGHFGIGDELDAEVRIFETLAKPTRLQVFDEPLGNVMAQIAERHDIQVVFDERALADLGIDPSNDAVTVDLENVRLRSALSLLLGSLDLTTLVRDEVLWITSKEVSEATLSTRIYRVDNEAWEVSIPELVETIQGIVRPGSWSVAGGEGKIHGVSGGMIVSNSASVHWEVSKMMRQIAQLYSTDD